MGLGRCPGRSESSFAAHAILIVTMRLSSTVNGIENKSPGLNIPEFIFLQYACFELFLTWLVKSLFAVAWYDI